MMMNDNDSPSSTSSTLSSISWQSRSSRSSLRSRSSGASRRTQNVLLTALTSVLFLTAVQLVRLSQLAAYNGPHALAYMEQDKVSSSRILKVASLHSSSEKVQENVVGASPESRTTGMILKSVAPIPPLPKRYAVVNVVENNKNYHLWGIYSIHKQMRKLQMLPFIKHVVLVSKDVKLRHRRFLRRWLGEDNVIVVDKKEHMGDYVPGGVWRAVFNLTQFDKVIGLDNDIFIRQDISSWFDYPVPAAIRDEASETIQWSSRVMVIGPSKELHDKLLEYISTKGQGFGGYNNGQRFLSSFFRSNVTNDTMYTMADEASVLISNVKRVKNDGYVTKYRDNAAQTIHLALDKGKTGASNSSSVECAVLQEWLESVADAPMDKLPELPDIIWQCPGNEHLRKPEIKQETVKQPSEKEIMAEAKRQEKLKRHKRAWAAHKRKQAGEKREEVLAPTVAPVKSSTTDICFVASVYGSSNAPPPSASELQNDDFAGSRFYLFTDMDNLNVPGWTSVVRLFESYKRAITRSRWAKYMAWKEPFIQDCGAVFFMEENLSPKSNRTHDFLDLVDWIVVSESGLAQNEAPRNEKHTLLSELKYTLRTNKDTSANVEAAKLWFESQSDFNERNHATVYDTGLFGYNPKNARFQAAATLFWDHYSKEQDMWNDQPLWAFTLDQLSLKPVDMGGRRTAYFSQVSASYNRKEAGSFETIVM